MIVREAEGWVSVWIGVAGLRFLGGGRTGRSAGNESAKFLSKGSQRSHGVSRHGMVGRLMQEYGTISPFK